MGQVHTSRRSFVGGAAAGLAVIGGLALVGRRLPGAVGAGDGITVVRGAMPAPSAMAGATPGASAWSALVGQPVSIAGEHGATAGTVLAVEAQPVRGLRPAGMAAPFFVLFAVARATAPAGDAIYDIGHEVNGLSRLFLQRGLDRGGMAILAAVFD